jgi:tripartite-type tricarboxylate transporter receptor subunit TctC
MNPTLTSRRHWLAAALLAASCTAFAQTPSTRIVVSFSPGGPVDFVARTLGEQLSKELGHTVVIDNKPGANGAIGATDVLRSPADGRTIWITSVGAAAINPALYEKLPYDMQRDFAPVSLVVNNVELLVVNPADPAKNATEFVARSKSQPQPLAMASSASAASRIWRSSSSATSAVPSCCTCRTRGRHRRSPT